MRHIIPTTFSIIVVLNSCSKKEELTIDYASSSLSVSRNTKTIIGEEDSITDYYVTDEDIDAYIHFKCLQTKDDSLVVDSIRPITFDSEGAICYLINYKDGWEIISADKRAPVVLAHKDEGHLTMDNLNQGGVYSAVRVWLNCLMWDIQRISETQDFCPYNDDAKRGMQQSIDFWNAISSPSTFIKEHQSETKAYSDPTPGSGHWVLISTTTTSHTSSVYLTTTQWGQGYPYNSYCPPPYMNAQFNSVAGCVAVAGAQQLYYLHNYLGIPQAGPTSVVVSGYGPLSYTMSFGPFSNSVWNNMNYPYSPEVATLIAYVGFQVSMQYGESASGANPDNLINNVFYQNGLHCSQYNSVPSSIVYNNLLSNLPIITTANDPYYTSNRHTFLIDKYKKTDYTTIYIYEWVEDPIIEDYNIPRAQQKQVIVYSTDITEIGMNWGWDGYYDNAWFSLSGNWCVNTSNYDANRTIIADFCAL